MKKEKAIETLNEFPTEFDLEELLEKLVFIDKVEKGVQQLEQGKTISHIEVKKKVSEW